MCTVAAPNTPWWEVYLRVPDGLSDEASEYLHSLGSSGVVFHEQALLLPEQEPCVVPDPSLTAWTVLQGAFPQDETLAQHLAALQQWLHTYAAESPGAALYGRPLHDMRYLTQWQQFFRPLCIGDRLMIRPPWEQEPLPPHLVGLTLNPGAAFGTGTHPSTHLCLQMLTHIASSFQGASLLDIGCGSGILSLAALQLGWQQAIGVDVDAQAIEVAVQNAHLNHLQDRVQFLHGSWQRVTGPFPCIVANIYLGPLVEMLPSVTRHLAPGGTLIVSGLLASQEGTMRLAIQHAGLAVQAQAVEDGWLALSVQHAHKVGSMGAPR